MRKAADLVTFEPRGIARLIREAISRQEYRLQTSQKAPMDRLVLETLGGKRAAWRVHYDVGVGKSRQRRKLKIGDHDTALPVVDQRWTEALARIKDGGDPAGDRATARLLQAEQAHMTVSKLVEDFIAAKASLRSVNQIKRFLDKDVVPALGKRPVGSIKPLDVELIVERIMARGSPVAARQAHTHLQAMFTWALKKAQWRAAGLGINPALLTAKPSRPAPRTRKLSDEQIRSLWRVLDSGAGLTDATIDACRLCLILARRADEVLGLPWSEIEGLDTPEPIWRLPRQRSKNKLEIVIPLPKLAADLLRRRREANAARKVGDCNPKPSSFVFAGERADASLTEGTLRTALRRMFVPRVAGVPPVLTCAQFSPHDFRRTVAHRLAEELDFSSEMIQALLGHRAAGVTEQHYIQASKLKRLRRVVDAWAEHLQCIIAIKTDHKVTNFMTARIARA